MCQKLINNNVWTITFSEPVIVTDYEEFKTSLQAKITGPRGEYKFQYEVYNPSDELKNSGNFTSFTVRIYDILAPIKGVGREKVEFWFSDLDIVKDLANNSLSEGQFSGNLHYHEYITSSKLND